MDANKSTLAIIGGTGNLGTGLALRWATAGYCVLLGSRSQEKADAALAALHAELADRGIREFEAQAMVNTEAAQSADIVILTVPFGHQRSTLTQLKPQLQGKILVDVTVPLVPPKVARVQLPQEGSAGQIAQSIVGENVRVVSAFQNVAAHHLQDNRGLDCDVLVCGDNKESRQAVIELIEAAGMRGFHAGPLQNAAAAEALTSVLIFINKQYDCHAGIRITGIAESR